MSHGGTDYLILDACVLIDYAEVDTSVLGTIATHVAPIAIARPVLDEVDQLDEDEAMDLGLDVVDLDLDVALEAGRSGGALSFEDWTCLLLAVATESLVTAGFGHPYGRIIQSLPHHAAPGNRRQQTPSRRTRTRVRR